MTRFLLAAAILVLFGFQISQLNAQTVSVSNNLVVQPVPDRTVFFSVSGTGVSTPILWGLDTAWPSKTNILRSLAFMGAANVSIVRVSFQPTDSLVNGDLQADQITALNNRINLTNLVSPDVEVELNDDAVSVAPWYTNNAAHWAALMAATAKRVEAGGHKVITIAPFNEPDYSGSDQGGMALFYSICGDLRTYSFLDNARICGGNTLNDDQALNWFSYLKSRLQEGNTHELAGSFDNYARFFKTVRADGKYATNDELHNLMDAMVGAEYGMQTGIWWGAAALARGEFVKATAGKRLCYAEDRPNWTAASVYRAPDGKVEAFGGTSEREAVTTTYRFISKDRDVYFDGYGPQREYTMVLPGGTGYQQGQTNAERVVNITWGDDIQPAINGSYVLVNRNSHEVMTVAGGNTQNGANIVQDTYTGAAYQQWDVTPVDSTIGGDFSYFTIKSVNSGEVTDENNFSLDNGANVQQWQSTNGINQQWYFDYAGNGWFYIRSRNSDKCLEVAKASTSSGANIDQWEKNGGTNQEWRLLPVGAPIKFVAPPAPTNLAVTSNAVSVKLTWTAPSGGDVASYTIFRSDSAGGPYNTIDRYVKSTSFVDNTAETGKLYFYRVKAEDNSLNTSKYSNEVSAATTGAKALVEDLKFEGNTLDSTVNLNHGAASGKISYVTGKEGKAIVFDGKDAFVQLPPTLANYPAITIAAWVYWKNGASGQHLFDFGNDSTHCMFLTPGNTFGKMDFSIENGGSEQQLEAPELPDRKWTHVTVTLGSSGAKIYVNGVLCAEDSTFTISPLDFKPVLNYIGRGQSPFTACFFGYLDDFRIYNYALSASQIAKLANASHVNYSSSHLSIGPVPADNILYVNYTTANNTGSSIVSVINMNGKTVLSEDINSGTELNVSGLPSGVYMVKLTNNKESLIKKLIIRH